MSELSKENTQATGLKQNEEVSKPRSTDSLPESTEDRSSEEDELEEKAHERSYKRGEVDSRTPAPPPNPMTIEEQRLQEGFSKVKSLLEDVERLKFSASVSGLDCKGCFSCFFWLTGECQLSWECGKRLSDLHKLVDRLQRDPHIRGLENSIPPLPEKRKNSSSRQSVNDPLTNLAQRHMLAEFVRQMFTSLSFLSHAVVLSTFEVPSIVRAKIDSLMKLCQSPILYSWLYKDCWNVKGWKRRWVVLYPDLTLRYYEKDGNDGAGKGFKGMIDIQALHRVISHRTEGNRHLFDITLKHCWEERLHPRLYKFWTPDVSLKLTWINAVTKLADGDVLKHTPKFSEIYEPACSLTSVNAWQLSLSSRLELEQANHVKMLTMLGELREELDGFKANRRSEQEVQEKLEDEWSELHSELERTKNDVQKGRRSIKKLKRQFGAKTQQWEEKFEEVERQIQIEREKYCLRSPAFLTPIYGSSREDPFGRRRRRRTLVENTSPLALSGQLDVLAGDSVICSCDVWFLKIGDLPYMEWSTGVDGRSGFRIKISGPVIEGSDKISFTVCGPCRSCKNVTFRAKSPEDRQKWIQALTNAQTNSSNDFNEEKTIDKYNEKAELQLKTSQQVVVHKSTNSGTTTCWSLSDFKEGLPVHMSIDDGVSERAKKLQALGLTGETSI